MHEPNCDLRTSKLLSSDALSGLKCPIPRLWLEFDVLHNGQQPRLTPACTLKSDGCSHSILWEATESVSSASSTGSRVLGCEIPFVVPPLHGHINPTLAPAESGTRS